MGSAPPALYPLFRSELQGRILTRVFLGGSEESIADLASAIEADPGNTSREVMRLETAGIVVSRRVGRTKLIRANTTAPAYLPLLHLITIVLGPAEVLREHLSNLDGIVFTDIFGSWTARFQGEPGPPPADIDLLVVGNPDRDDLHDATEEASRRLNRPVNPMVISEQRWHTSNDGFVRQLRSRPRVPVIHQRKEQGS